MPKLVASCSVQTALVCLGVTCLIAAGRSANSEPLGRVGEFYPKNYANQELQRDLAQDQVRSKTLGGAQIKRHSQTDPESAHSFEQGNAAKSSYIAKNKESAGNSAEPAKAASSPPALAAQDHMPPVVTLYVSSLDREHFNRAFNSALKLQHSGMLSVSAIWHVGDYRNITAVQQDALARAGFNLLPLSSLPDNLQGRQSPLWAVLLADGPAYLSGIFDIMRFIGLDGKLKRDLNSAAPVSPAQKLDGF